MRKVYDNHVLQSKVSEIGLCDKTNLIQAVVFVDAHENRFVEFLFVADEGAKQIFQGGIDQFNEWDLVDEMIKPITCCLESKVRCKVTEGSDANENEEYAQARVRQRRQT